VIVRFMLLCVLILPLNGCQTRVAVQVPDYQLTKPPVPSDIKVTLLSKARDIRDKPRNQIGRHFFIVLPGPQVEPREGPLDRDIPKAVQQALEVAGYTVTMVDRLHDAPGPVVVAQIDDLRNYSFAFYPLGIGRGRMQLSLHVVTSDGKELWSGKTNPNGGMIISGFYMSGFITRIHQDLKDSLNQIVAMASTEEFKKHIRPQ